MTHRTTTLGLLLHICCDLSEFMTEGLVIIYHGGGGREEYNILLEKFSGPTRHNWGFLAIFSCIFSLGVAMYTI